MLCMSPYAEIGENTTVSFPDFAMAKVGLLKLLQTSSFWAFANLYYA